MNPASAETLKITNISQGARGKGSYCYGFHPPTAKHSPTYQLNAPTFDIGVVMQISKHFTLEELTLSQTAVRRGLDNSPDETALDNLRALCEYVLEPLREAAEAPIHINSGYRAPLVNKAVGGVATSQHCFGQAADITIPGLSISEVISLVRSLKLPVDQCIDEFNSWTHMSYRADGKNRRQFLAARTRNGRTVYASI
jgi:zinc D-Ala-D-Ala carboxypeptidase